MRPVASRTRTVAVAAVACSAVMAPQGVRSGSQRHRHAEHRQACAASSGVTVGLQRQCRPCLIIIPSSWGLMMMMIFPLDCSASRTSCGLATVDDEPHHKVHTSRAAPPLASSSDESVTILMMMLIISFPKPWLAAASAAYTASARVLAPHGMPRCPALSPLPWTTGASATP